MIFLRFKINNKFAQPKKKSTLYKKILQCWFKLYRKLHTHKQRKYKNNYTLHNFFQTGSLERQWFAQSYARNETYFFQTDSLERLWFAQSYARNKTKIKYCMQDLCLYLRYIYMSLSYLNDDDYIFFSSESQTIEDFGAALHLMRSDLEHLRSVFMAVENGDLGMLKSLGIKDSELGDVKFFLEKLVNTGFLDWIAPEPASDYYFVNSLPHTPIIRGFYSYLPYDSYNYK